MFLTLEDLIAKSLFGEDYVMSMLKNGDIQPFMVSEEDFSLMIFSEEALYRLYEEEIKNLA